MSDLAELQAQVADLQAKLAQLMPPTPPPFVSAPAEPAPPRPVRLHTLIGGVEMGRLHRDARTVRQLAEAVALCRGASSPAQEVPADWVPDMRRLAAARAAGRSWRDALAEAGLEVPGDLTEQAQAVRLEVDALWDRLLPLVGLTLDSTNSVVQDRLKMFLRCTLA